MKKHLLIALGGAPVLAIPLLFSPRLALALDWERLPINSPSIGEVSDLMQASDGSIYASIYHSSYSDGHDGVYRTVDGGHSWTQMASWPEVRNAVKVFQAPDGAILVGTGRGPNDTDPGRIYRSTDSGSTWVNVLTCPSSQQYLSTIFHSPDGYLYAGTLTATSGPVAGVYRSSDGIAWTPVGAPPEPQVTDFAAAPLGSLYAATTGSFSDGKIYKSVDHGDTWTLQSDFSGTFGIQALQWDSGGRLWAVGEKASHTPAVYWSPDGGNTWNDVSNLTGSGTSTASDLVDCPDGFMYVSIDSGTSANDAIIYRSNDLGQTWSVAGTFVDMHDVSSLLLSSDNYLYAGAGTPETAFTTLIPEPASLSLLGLALLPMALRRRR